jgi:alanyl aminopeptidase
VASALDLLRALIDLGAMRAAAKLVIALLFVSACAAEEQAPVAPTRPSATRTPAPPAAREDGRLPPLARPERYALSLVVDPTQPKFSGTTRILTSVAAPTWYLVLHGRNLDVKRAVARAGGAEIPASVSARPSHGGHDNEELLLTFAAELPAGKATLTLDYEAHFDESLAGLYHLRDDQSWYAFTQFEATDARRAFPCFDEPGFKVSFDVSITVPKGMIAVANTPETARHDAGASTTFDFATTQPLPTYLLAFAVGDLDVRQGPTAPVPIRLIATKGKAGLGQLAIDATAGLTQKLAGYFGIAYPYAKLDIVAVPNFAAGAMENAGFITFREEVLLIDPAHASARTKREMTVTVAHELAHQWFGDLVTMAWWNDLWLNEGFATWAESKMADAYKPGFEARIEHVTEMSEVMDTDSLRSARAVRQPVASTSEAMEAFDDITYQKGASVLAMLEHSIGEAVFQKGVRAYLTKNAWKNATADDLLQALDEASGKDVTSLASSFLDRPGVPNVAVTTSCTGSGETVAMKQSPWRRLGQDAGAQAAPWWVPVGVTSSVGERAAKLLASPTDEIRLTKCAPWVFPNTDEAGYYRFSLDEKSWVEMGKSFERLDTADRVGFLGNLWGQTRSGELSPEIVLRTLPALDGEKDRFVISQEIDVLQSLSNTMVTDETRPAFRRYVLARLAPHMKAMGPAGGRRDDASAMIERSVTAGLGDLAEDDATLKDAARVSLLWLHDPDSVEPDLAAVDLVLGSRRAAPERIDALRAAIRAAKTPEARSAALRALGGFGEPETLQRALDVILSDDVKTQDVYNVLGVAMARRASRKTTFDWIVGHWEPLRKKLPGFLVSGIFGLAGYACSKEERSAASDFFQPRAKDVEGSERPLAEALEAASLCEALRDKYAADVSHFFATAAPPTAPAAAPAQAAPKATSPAPKASGPGVTAAPPKRPAR